MISPSRPDIADLGELLAFYAEAGVDEALSEEPVDRFSQPAPAPRQGRADASIPARPERQAPAPQQQSTAQGPAHAAAAIPDEAQAALARELAASAATLDDLRSRLEGFEGCNLKFTAKNTVFADGNPQAPIMLVGEAPGRDEDLEGLPFVGRSGQLLDRILAAIGLDRSNVYIANTIAWRPPGNRTPTPHETEICRPFIERQIELVNPRILVTLGGPSAKLLLNATEGILRLRGNWRRHETKSGTAIPAMPTLHPAYLLRNPAHKKLAWRDFLEVKAKLREVQEG
jgi:DNA polymerase